MQQSKQEVTEVVALGKKGRKSTKSPYSPLKETYSHSDRTVLVYILKMQKLHTFFQQNISKHDQF